MSVLLAQDGTGTKVIAVVTPGPQGPPGAVVGAAGTGFLFYNAGVAVGALPVDPTLATNFTVGAANTVLTSNGATGAWATIVNANISSSAAIAVSKLAAGSNGQFLGVVGGVPTWTAVAAGVVKSTGSALVSAGLGAGLQVLRTNADRRRVGHAELTGIASTGAGAGVVANGVSGANVQVKSLVAGTNVTITNNLNDITIAAAGATVPTGTGFWHITAGASDAASKKVDLTAAADVTVPATANGVVRSTGTVLADSANFTEDGSGNATLATSLAIGGSGATAGYIRLPYNGAAAVTVLGVNDSGSVQRAFITYGSGDAWTVGNTSQDLSAKFKNNYSIDNGTVTALVSNGTNVYLGMNSSFTAMHSNVEIYPSATIAMGINGVDYFQVNGIDGTLKGAVPFVGESAANSPWSGMNGTARVTCSNGANTAAAADYAMTYIRLSGPTVAYTYSLPAVSSLSQGYPKFIVNAALNANAPLTINVVGGGGGNVTTLVGSGTQRLGCWVWVDTGGVRQLTAAFDVGAAA